MALSLCELGVALTATPHAVFAPELPRADPCDLTVYGHNDGSHVVMVKLLTPVRDTPALL